jgi:hypothetical protein
MHQLCVLMGILLTQSAPAQNCPFFRTISLASWIVFPAVTMEGILLWSWLLSEAYRKMMMMMMMGLQWGSRSVVDRSVGSVCCFGRRLFRSSCSYICAGTVFTGCARWGIECLFVLVFLFLFLPL